MRTEKLYDPILVMSPGPAGAGIVSGILWRLGIYMGAGFSETDAIDPCGTFEDGEVALLFRQRIENKCGDSHLHMRLQQFIFSRRAMYRMWGVNSRHNVEFSELWFRYLPFARVIWCDRPDDEVVADMVLANPEKEPEELRKIVTDRRGWFEEKVAPCRECYRVPYHALLKDPSFYVKDLFEFVYLDRVEFATSAVPEEEKIKKGKAQFIHA